MITVQFHDDFEESFLKIKDSRAIGRISARIVRAQKDGNLGATRSLGDGLHEMKIDYGPGYRVYFTYRGSDLIILLCAGDKSRQQRDIAHARNLMLTTKGY
ncbi:type II toxin-antitoxin system RelE/ParE family toxin [Salipiger pacificus]|nr:type II toxin-antitoxin system RelE/ParE family toxin [Alloyangia pacifica]